MSSPAPAFSTAETIDLACLAWSSGESAAYAGSVTLRQMEVLERVPGASARKPAQVERSTQESMVAKFARERATSPARPPMDSAHLSPSRASSTHNIEGVLMVSP